MKAIEIIAQVWDPLMDELPSNSDSLYHRVRDSFEFRKEYISKFGYMLLTKEVQSEMVQKFNELDVDSFIELGAGTGSLTKVLIDAGLSGVGYTLPIPENEHHWGFEAKGSLYNYCVQKKILELGDMRDLINITVPKMVISSWVPYEEGQEVLDFFNTNGYPEYYTVVGEGYGGCTASDDFHQWLEKNYTRIDSIASYESFIGIYDRIEIYKKK